MFLMLGSVALAQEVKNIEGKNIEGKNIVSPQENTLQEDTKQKDPDPQMQVQAPSVSKAPAKTSPQVLDTPHYKGKWKYVWRSYLSTYAGSTASEIDVVFDFGAAYNILDSLRVEGYMGIGTYISSQKMGLMIPTQILLSYALTNFHNQTKNLAIYVGGGYDMGIVNTSNNKFAASFSAESNKLHLDVGIQFGKTLGFRVSYIPPIGLFRESLIGGSFVMKWK
ncbi:hypothetical protein BKH46_09245 [Helicobacter sp. 12S02634-8]|nr:hypothetical protein BKH46_09245 [Helicobacter sp. 12S02634-8]